MTKFRGVRFTCIDELNVGCQGDPVMKGGHTHNHQRNALERKLNRSKESRKRCHNVLNKGFEYKIVRKGNDYFVKKIKEKMKKVEDTEIPINAPVLGIIGAIVARTSPSYREPTPEEIEMREKVWDLTKGLCDIQEEEAEKERALQRGRVALKEDFENDDDTMIHLFRD